MLVILLGIFIEAKLLQPKKAQFPMLVTSVANLIIPFPVSGSKLLEIISGKELD